MDDSRPFHVTAGGGVREEAVDERPSCMPGRGVNDETGRLVDDEEVLVLVRDAEIHRFGCELGRCALRRFELDVLASRQTVTLSLPATVHEHSSRLHQPLGHAPRPDRREGRQEAVEPLACGGFRNALLHARAAVASPCGQKRRARATARRHRPR